MIVASELSEIIYFNISSQENNVAKRIKKIRKRSKKIENAT